MTKTPDVHPARAAQKHKDEVEEKERLRKEHEKKDAKGPQPASAQPMTDQAFVPGSTADSQAHKDKHKLDAVVLPSSRKPRVAKEGGDPMPDAETADHLKHR